MWQKRETKVIEVAGSQSGFPKKSQGCNANVPCHLPNKLEYKFLGPCVFIAAGPITKLFAGGGGGEWTTCAMIDDEPRPVWMSPLITH